MHLPFKCIMSACFCMLLLAFQHNAPRTGATTNNIKNRIESYLRRGETLLKEGDIVLRMNQDPFSEFIRYFNKKDKSFSHAGLVINDGGSLMIYHMASEHGNPMKLMLKQKLSRFADPRHNSGYAIYRYAFSQKELNKIRSLLNDWYQLPVHFDTAFNLATNNELYCSEMVQKAIVTGTHNRIKITSTSLNSVEANAIKAYYNLPSKPGMEIIAIDDLYMNAACVKVAGFSYE